MDGSVGERKVEWVALQSRTKRSRGGHWSGKFAGKAEKPVDFGGEQRKGIDTGVDRIGVDRTGQDRTG